MYRARVSCGGPPRGWWRSGLLLWVKRVDNDQSSAATRARDGTCSGLVVCALDMLWFRCFGPEQFSYFGDIGRTVAVSEEAIVADAVLAAWQDVDQEPADELWCRQCHGGLSFGAADAVIFDAEGDLICIGSDQTAIGNGNPMGGARQVRQHC
jgi:hypothetical protein